MITSGIGLTAARAEELRAFAQINVSTTASMAARGRAWVRGRAGRGAGHRRAGRRGHPRGRELRAHAELIARLDATAARVADLGAGEIQLLRYKPAGRADDPSYDDRRLAPEQQRAVAGHRADHRGRGACACASTAPWSRPLGGAPHRRRRARGDVASSASSAAGGADHLGALTVAGDAGACSFLPPKGEVPIPLGAARRDLAASIDADPFLGALRAYHAAPPEPCRSCALFSVCRGGCQVVSRRAHGGAFAPISEVPRACARHTETQRARDAVTPTRDPAPRDG